jgi:hypothetical protein
LEQITPLRLVLAVLARLQHSKVEQEEILYFPQLHLPGVVVVGLQLLPEQ